MYIIRFRRLAFLVIAAFGLLAGCRDDTGISVDGFEELTIKGWLLTGFMIKYSHNPNLPLSFSGEVNALDSARDCELDDVIYFGSDYSYRLMDEGTACPDSPPDGIRESGVWYLSENQREFSIDLLKNQRYLQSLQTLDLNNTVFRVQRFHTHVLTLVLNLKEEYRPSPTSKPIEFDLEIELELRPL